MRCSCSYGRGTLLSFYRHTIWTNKDHNIENAIVITPLIQVNPKNGVYVAEVLTPHPQTFEHFMC